MRLSSWTPTASERRASAAAHLDDARRELLAAAHDLDTGMMPTGHKSVMSAIASVDDARTATAQYEAMDRAEQERFAHDDLLQRAE